MYRQSRKCRCFPDVYKRQRYDLSSGDYQYGLRNMNACIEAAKILKNSRYLMDSYLQMIYYAIQVYDLDMMKEYIMYCSELLEEYQYSKSTPYTIQRLKALYYSKTEQFDKAEQILESLIPVSYTHLDVYKRQPF